MGEGEGMTVSRRGAALAGLGLAGLVAGSVASTGVAHADTGNQKIVAITIAELRDTITPEAGTIYYVTDPGQEGPFRFDPDDTSTKDNTGIVLVSKNGHRFKRAFTGPLRIAWFGAKADYDPIKKIGTPSDGALQAAFEALKPFAHKTPWTSGFELGLPAIAFDAGNYLFVEKQHYPRWYPALQGLSLHGAGLSETNLFFDCPESENGTDNYFLYNNNRIYGLQAEGLSFWAVTGTERFIYVSSKGTAGKTLFSQCLWNGWQVGFDIAEARANADLNKFEFCRTRNMKAGSTFFSWNNPQSVINSFIDCDFQTSGILFDVRAGGIITIVGGSYITFDEGVLLNIDDPTGAGVGVGNGQFSFYSIKPEIRQASQLVRMNAPEAHVEFVGCDFAVGNSNFASTWATSKSYAVGDRVRVGAKSPSLGRAFRCTKAHTSEDGTRPLTGKDWRSVWQALYEIQLDSGSVHIRGGTLAYTAQLRYSDDSYQGSKTRPELTVTEGCYLVNPLADSVDFTADGAVTNSASIPRASATGCRPYTGAYPQAYWVTPTDPVDVTLNAEYGFDGATTPRHSFVFRASPTMGEGLPSSADGKQTFLLPRGAHVLGVRLVTPKPIDLQAYQVTSFDGSVTFLPSHDNGRVQQSDVWYPVESEAERTIVVTSTAPARADGFVLVEYM